LRLKNSGIFDCAETLVNLLDYQSGLLLAKTPTAGFDEVSQGPSVAQLLRDKNKGIAVSHVDHPDDMRRIYLSHQSQL
jgi:hypothetical protein